MIEIAGVALLVTLAYFIGWDRGRAHGEQKGYREGWQKRERYGNGGRRQWWNKTVRPKWYPK